MNISYQLYGSRNWPLDETLKMLAEAGYAEVEGYGGVFGDAEALKRALDAAGLAMTTGHFGLDMLESDADGVITLARGLGIGTVFAPYLVEGDRPTDQAGWESFAARLAEAGKPVMDAGLGFGWHNHDFELADLGGGVMPLDLIAAASPDLTLELDIGWVTRAGLDPEGVVARYGSMISVSHIKDVAPAGENADEDGWSDVGAGVTDWTGVHAALQAAGVERYVIEHDNPADHVRFAVRSLAAVKAF
jgi:sugar phosphate isomerase/epimerase